MAIFGRSGVSGVELSYGHINSIRASHVMDCWSAVRLLEMGATNDDVFERAAIGVRDSLKDGEFRFFFRFGQIDRLPHEFVSSFSVPVKKINVPQCDLLMGDLRVNTDHHSAGVIDIQHEMLCKVLRQRMSKVSVDLPHDVLTTLLEPRNVTRSTALRGVMKRHIKILEHSDPDTTRILIFSRGAKNYSNHHLGMRVIGEINGKVEMSVVVNNFSPDRFHPRRDLGMKRNFMAEVNVDSVLNQIDIMRL